MKEPVLKDVDLPTFQSWLKKGLGRAVLYLKEHDPTPYRDSLLHACITNVSYDPQLEDGRALYLWNLINLTKNKPLFRNAILQELVNRSETRDNYDWAQIFSLAELFASDGDSETRQAMYTAFKHLQPEKLYISNADVFIRIDLKDFFSRLASLIEMIPMEITGR